MIKKKMTEKKELSSVWPSDPRSQKILLVLIASLCAITATVFAYALYHEWYVLETVYIPMRVNITEGSTIGFDLNDTVLSFGKVPRGGSGERVLRLYSESASRASLFTSGPIGFWTSLSDHSITFSPGDSHNVTVIISVPQDAPLGYQEGIVAVVYTRRFW